jgi:hypothetical protein
MKTLRRWMAGLFVASWMLLLVHAHPVCAGDVHSEHAACQACAVVGETVNQGVLAVSPDLSLPGVRFEPAASAPEFSFPSESSLRPSSRAPPR